MRRPGLFIAVALSLAACSQGVHPVGDGGGPAVDAPMPIDAPVEHLSIAPAPDLLLAYDPRLTGATGWPLRFVVDPGFHATVSCSIALARGATALATVPGTVAAGVCTATWDAHVSGGGPVVAPGAITATASLLDGASVLATTMQPLEVVRLGITEVTLSDPTDRPLTPLVYSAAEHHRGNMVEVPADDPAWRIAPDHAEPTGASALDRADGTPRTPPAIWTDTLSPPLDTGSADGLEHDSYSLPHAFVSGTQVVASLLLDATAAGGIAAGPVHTEIHVVPPTGLVATSDDTFTSGGTVTVQAMTSPVPNVARYNLSWRFGFSVRGPGGALVPMPGHQDIALRLYGLVAPSALRATGTDADAWVDMVDQVAEWVDGATADPTMVSGKVVEGVYFSSGLRYDRMSGASAYTDYSGPGWSNAYFYAGAYQDRAYGSVINCSDAASIVSTFANMIGVGLNYHILATSNVLADPGASGGFPLNYLQGIGSTSFAASPFTSGRASFRYHAVTGPDLSTFFDATAALDGDADPSALPATFLLAEGLPAAEYIMRLSSDPSVVASGLNEKVVLR